MTFDRPNEYDPGAGQMKPCYAWRLILVGMLMKYFLENIMGVLETQSRDKSVDLFFALIYDLELIARQV